MQRDLSLIPELLAFLISFKIMILSWWYSSCSQQKLLRSSLTAANFQIYQPIQFCLPLPVPHFSYCFPKGMFLLTETDCGKVWVFPVYSWTCFSFWVWHLKILGTVSSKSTPNINRISPESKDGDEGRSLWVTLVYKWQQIHHFRPWFWGKAVMVATINVKLSVSTHWADELPGQLLDWTSEGTWAKTYLKSSYGGS